MNNKKLIYAFACGLSIFFAGIYYAVFVNLAQDESKSAPEEVTLYMNQVGLYKQRDSIDKMKRQLETIGLSGYQRDMGDVTAVVCGVSESKKTTEKTQETLTKNNITFLLKSAKTKDSTIIQKIRNKDFAGALEMMKVSK